MIDLFLVRHGETTYNAEKIMQGRLDIPLSDSGKNGVELLGKQMRGAQMTFSVALSSPLIRAKETAGIILSELGLASLPIHVMEEFNERSFGTWEGQHLENFKDIFASEEFSNVPGYESDNMIIKRVGQGLGKIEKSYEGCSVLLVSHSNALKALLSCVDPVRYDFSTSIPNLDVVHLLFDGVHWNVINLNLFGNDKPDLTV